MEEAVQQNLEAIDDLFVQTVQAELEQARKDGNLDRSARLGQILSVIEAACDTTKRIGFGGRTDGICG